MIRSFGGVKVQMTIKNNYIIELVALRLVAREVNTNFGFLFLATKLTQSKLWFKFLL